MGAYGADLAYIHDAGFTALARGAARRLVELLAARGIERGLVVELGCGSGASAAVLTAAGFDVLGIDSSQEMVALARGNAPQARFVVGSFVEAELPRCIAVTAFGEVLNYLTDERRAPAAVRRTAARVHAALQPGGVFLLDVAGPGRARGTERRWAAGEDWAVLTESEERRSPPTLTRRITAFRRAGALYRRTEETHVQRLHRASEVLALLRDAGFRARALRGYAGERFAPGHSVLVASR